MIVVALSFLASILFIMYFLSTLRYNYWKNKKVPYPSPAAILGNYGDYILLKLHMGTAAQKLYKQFPGEPYFGAFYGTEPVLIVRDPAIIKLVLAKDFYYFSSREVTKYTDNEVLTRNVFFSGGDRWKVTRQNLTPLFSSAKMKNMFYLIGETNYTFEKMMDKYMQESSKFEARAIMARFTVSVVCSCAFGIDPQVMEKPANNPFVDIAFSIFENTTYRGFKNVARAVWPALFYGAGFKSFPLTIDKFFTELITGIFQGRGYKPSSRNDFVDMVLGFKENEHLIGDSLSNMKTGESKKVHIAVDEPLLTAQCITIFAAGFETTASTLSFTLYEIAKNKAVQQKAQEEIDAFLKKHHNQMTYDNIKELTYLDACIDESMRLYPVLGVLTREVVDKYTFPSGLQLDKEMRVHIPVHAIHRDPAHFPDPEVFKPERFLPENRRNIKPYTYLPFGEGPRICIGARFARMTMLPALVTVLKKFTLELAPGTPSKLELDARSIVTQPTNGIHLQAAVRQGWQERLYATVK